jgi:flagellar L-ring protein FlgH
MKRWLFALSALGLTALSVTRADSIWDRRDSRYAYLFQDNQARVIGDTLIVSLAETTVASDQDARTLNRTTSGSGQVTLFKPLNTPASTAAGATTGSAAQTLLQFPSQNTAYAFNGSAQTTTNHTLTDTMAVTVVDLMPNGNLVVEGFRTRVVEGEERVLRITGIVRPADIGVGNTISSGAIANCSITYLGRGPATRTNKQGFLSRLNSLIRLF